MLFRWILIALAAVQPGLAAQPVPAPESGKQAVTAFKFPRVEDRSLQTSATQSKYGVEYRVTVSKPGGERPAAGYPVVYVIDGNAWAGVAAEVARLSEIEVGKALVVGIGYPIEGLFDVQRFLDLTLPGPIAAPPLLPDLPELKYGGANRFLDFIESEVRPMIQREYGVDASRQVLFGHSLGGLFALHVLFTKPEAFTAYIAASPSIHWNDRALLAEESKAAGAKPAYAGRQLLVTAGEYEQKADPRHEEQMRRMLAQNPQYLRGRSVEQAIEEGRRASAKGRMVDNAKELAQRMTQSGLRTEFFEFPGENHLTVVPVALNRTLPIALRPAR